MTKKREKLARPSISQLEALSDKGKAIEILPNGEVRVGEKEESKEILKTFRKDLGHPY